MKYVYLLIIFIFILLAFTFFVKVEKKKDAVNKIRLIKNTLAYRIEKKIDTDITVTTFGRSVGTINNYIKYF